MGGIGVRELKSAIGSTLRVHVGDDITVEGVLHHIGRDGITLQHPTFLQPGGEQKAVGTVVIPEFSIILAQVLPS